MHVYLVTNDDEFERYLPTKADALEEARGLVRPYWDDSAGRWYNVHQQARIVACATLNPNNRRNACKKPHRWYARVRVEDGRVVKVLS